MKLLNEILGTRYPIIQGGMANIATGEFAAACSNAGALGIIGAGGMNADTLRENIRRCKQLTTKPFGVNIMLMHPQADEFAKIVVEEGVQVVTTGAGNPGQVCSHVESRRHQGHSRGGSGRAGKASGAAGHRRRHCRGHRERRPCGRNDHHGAGAAGSGRGAYSRHCGRRHRRRPPAGGCAGPGCLRRTVGTCLLASEECPIHENYKAALLKAKDSDTIVTGRSVGAPVRVLKNRMSREYVRQEKAGADKMELEKYTLGSLRRGPCFGGATPPPAA